MMLPTDDLTDYGVSDEAAAYIADALMELALKFEATHLAQIRRHHDSLQPESDDSQLDLFRDLVSPCDYDTYKVDDREDQ